jgi:cold shock CspA family protein
MDGWMPYGKIEKWIEDRGFGFLSDDQQPLARGVFVHISDIGHAPNVGDAFSYDLVDGRDGRPKASNVRSISVAREEVDRVFGAA